MNAEPARRRRPAAWLRAGALLALLALAVGAGRAATAPAGVPAAAAAASDVAAAPTLEGRDLDWTDAARQRAVPVRLYWPAAAAEGPVPLVVFSHGIGGSRRGYSYLGRFFAGHGIASLHVQHVGSDRALWRGNPLTLVGRLQAAARDEEAIERARDIRFALDELLERSDYGPRIDRRRIAVAGHSYGANTAMLVAGASVERGGRLVSLRDERVAAALLLSAPPFYGEADPSRILGAVTMPTLHVTATEDVIRVPGYHSPPSDRLAVFEATGSPLKALAVFRGGSHNIFTDRTASGGLALNAQVKAATQALALAFLRQVFDGLGDGLQRWPQAWSQIVENWVPPRPAEAAPLSAASPAGASPDAAAPGARPTPGP